VAKHLRPSGVFVIEAFVPDMTRFQGRQANRAVEVGLNEVRLDVSQFDSLNQQIISQHILPSEEGIRLYPVKLRYIWPSELDPTVRLSAMRLKHRWGSWEKAGFSDESVKHISVNEHVD
jgi:hypothetical protein